MGKNFTAYIQNDNADHFSQEDSPNSLINNLLRDHYSKVAKEVNGYREKMASVGVRTKVEVGSIEQTPDGYRQTVKVVPNPDDVAKAKQKMADTIANLKADGDRAVAKGTPKTEGEFTPIAEDEVEELPESSEQPCCNQPAPCKHWTWDGTNQVWKNTLSGREKENA